MKEKHPHIKRIYVRAEYPYISDDYKKYLLENYEDKQTRIIGSGKAVYVERNCEMIDKSDICIFYYDDRIASKMHKSGTKTAVEYSLKQNKHVIKLSL